MGYIDEFADYAGASAGSLRLLLTVYIAYIFAGFHRKFLFGKPGAQQHLFFTASALALLYWNYGYGLVHPMICIFVQWLIFQVVGTSTLSVAISFPFQLGYLLCGYVWNSTEGYDVNWTMAHCILTLRLIGLSFDVYDGHRNQEKVSPEQKTLMIENIPSLLEMFGFCNFIGGFSIGPQFPLRRYRLLVKGELTDTPGKRPNSLIPAFRRCLSGTIILGLQVLADMYFPMNDVYSGPEFYEASIFWRMWVICLRGHILLYQYVGIWMVNEGVCILTGLGYHKVDNKDKWDAVRNIKLRTFAFSTSFQEIIDSFNMNTNQWAARYVFKRLKFVGNRTVSHVSTLFFLAIWHGYHEGYLGCFSYEFLVMSVEKPLRAVLHESALVRSFNSSKWTSWIPNVVGFLYVRLIFGYCLLDFSLRKWRFFYPIYLSVYYYGHFFYIILWILLKLYLSMKTKKKEKVETKAD